MSRLVFLDTETTGLDPTVEDLFEIAAIGQDGTEKVWRVEPRPSVVKAMHPKAVEVNRYHERTADLSWTWDNPGYAAVTLRSVLDGAHIVGAVPDFDTRFLTEWYRRLGVRPPRWHYHLIDIEAVAVGWLYGRDAFVRDLPLPWDSDDLSRAVGVEPPTDDRHTALGDARWCRRVWQAITGADHG